MQHLKIDSDSQFRLLKNQIDHFSQELDVYASNVQHTEIIDAFLTTSHELINQIQSLTNPSFQDTVLIQQGLWRCSRFLLNEGRSEPFYAVEGLNRIPSGILNLVLLTFLGQKLIEYGSNELNVIGLSFLTIGLLATASSPVTYADTITQIIAEADFQVLLSDFLATTGISAANISNITELLWSIRQIFYRGGEKIITSGLEPIESTLSARENLRQHNAEDKKRKTIKNSSRFEGS